MERETTAANSVKADYLWTGDTIRFGKYFVQTVRGIRICLLRDYLFVHPTTTSWDGDY